MELRSDHPPANETVFVETPDPTLEFLGYEAAWPLDATSIEPGTQPGAPSAP